jgi:hypothetical protein
MANTLKSLYKSGKSFYNLVKKPSTLLLGCALLFNPYSVLADSKITEHSLDEIKRKGSLCKKIIESGEIKTKCIEKLRESNTSKEDIDKLIGLLIETGFDMCTNYRINDGETEAKLCLKSITEILSKNHGIPLNKIEEKFKELKEKSTAYLRPPRRKKDYLYMGGSDLER